MKAAIYSRKSKITEKGDSIENQISICKNYLSSIQIQDYMIYEDEGFSGKNTKRPEFQKMISDAKDKKFDVIICYKLDRVSRNVSDFSSFIEFLNKCEIGFISITEKFDTTNPMGRAMMYISSVFAQLERETISQRVKDNMTELAKCGRWLGGMTPTGFESKKITITDDKLKTRVYYELSPIEGEVKLVKLIYKKYLETKSISQVEKYLLSNNYKTKLNTDWSKSKVREILKHPVYVKASDEVLEYLGAKGISVIGEPDSIHGMLLYRRRKGKSGYNSTTLWLAVIGKHEGIISSDEWLKVQKTLDENRKMGARTGTTSIALLSGLIICKHCGSKMRVQHGKILKSTGMKKFFYVCSLKYNSGCTRCKNSNLDGPEIEKLVINKMRDINIVNDVLIRKLSEFKRELYKDTIDDEYLNISNELRKTEVSINNMVKTISLTQDEEISKVLIDKLKDLTENQQLLKMKITNIGIGRERLENEKMDEAFSWSQSFIEACEFEEKKEFLNSLIEKIYWDGKIEKLDIIL